MTICNINADFLNLFAKIILKREESCKNIQKKARFLANLLSSVFYLSISIFISYPFLLSFNFYLCRFSFPSILSGSALRVSPSAYRLCRGSASDG